MGLDKDEGGRIAFDREPDKLQWPQDGTEAGIAGHDASFNPDCKHNNNDESETVV